MKPDNQPDAPGTQPKERGRIVENYIRISAMKEEGENESFIYQRFDESLFTQRPMQGTMGGFRAQSIHLVFI